MLFVMRLVAVLKSALGRLASKCGEGCGLLVVLSLVVLNESLHRGLYDASQCHAFGLEGFLQLRTEIEGDGAVEAHGQLVPAFV